MTRFILAIANLALLAAAFACGDDNSSADPTATGAGGSNTPSAEKSTLRLGYFPNVTHAPGLIAVARGTFEEALGPSVTLETKSFNAGPDVINALFAGEIDVSYIGPNPAINGYQQSDGEALRIISGSTSGGALFVVRPDAGIASAADLSGKKIATPSLGNTQDVALRSYLLDNGLDSTLNGGDVEVIPTQNSDTLALFRQGALDGAWVPEPWASRLVQEAGGEVFVDEHDLWPNGDFVTTQIIVRTGYLEDHPGVIKNFLRGHVETIQWIEANPEEAKTVTNQAIEDISGAPLAPEVIDASWEHLKFTYDPIASSLRESAATAFELEFLDEEPDLDDPGIYALEPLNAVLQEMGLPAVGQ